MKFTNNGVFISKMVSAMPYDEVTKFVDGDGVTIWIDTEVVLRLASLIEFERERKKEIKKP